MTIPPNGPNGTHARPGADPGHQGSDQRIAARSLAVLRVLLLPIVLALAGDRLVSHPTVGTRHFDLVLGIACGCPSRSARKPGDREVPDCR